jgi:hypothetical protein
MKEAEVRETRDLLLETYKIKSDYNRGSAQEQGEVGENKASLQIRNLARPKFHRCQGVGLEVRDGGGGGGGGGRGIKTGGQCCPS